MRCIYAGSLIQCRTGLLLAQAERYISAELHLEQIIEADGGGRESRKNGGAVANGRCLALYGSVREQGEEVNRAVVSTGRKRCGVSAFSALRRAGCGYTVPDSGLIITRLEGRAPVPAQATGGVRQSPNVNGDLSFRSAYSSGGGASRTPAVEINATPVAVIYKATTAGKPDRSRHVSGY